MKFKEILYENLEGNKLTENGKKLLGLREIGWSNGKEICENGNYMVRRNKKTGEVVEVHERVKPKFDSYNKNEYKRQKTICECPSENSRSDDTAALSNYSHRKDY